MFKDLFINFKDSENSTFGISHNHFYYSIRVPKVFIEEEQRLFCAIWKYHRKTDGFFHLPTLL